MPSTADEETSGVHGVQWMIANHVDEIDAEYVLDEGGMGSRDALAAGKLAFGVSVGEKQMLWLRLRARGTAAARTQPDSDTTDMILLGAIPNARAPNHPQPAHPLGAQ